MLHYCLPVLFFASNNKKRWIVSFLALPSLPDVKHCCFLFSFHICQFSLYFVRYIQSLLPSHSLTASLLFIHGLVSLCLSLSFSLTNASRCHISLLSMYCHFICFLSLPSSCASSISLYSPARVQNIDN